MKLLNFNPSNFLNKTGVYTIMNNNGDCYIGSSRQLDKRIQKYVVSSSILPSQILKSLIAFGPENHYVFILEICDDDISKQDLFDLEDKHIVESIKVHGESKILNQRTNKKGLWISPNYKKFLTEKMYTQIDKLDLKGRLICSYDSISQAVKDLGKTNNGLISNCINGKVRNVYGFRWRKSIKTV